MRLIDADALDRAFTELRWEDDHITLKHWGDRPNWCLHGSEVERLIKEAPTIEAEPVRRGRWSIKSINMFEMAYGTTAYEPVYECSVCGGVEESYLRLDEPLMPEDADFPRYCPNCGARMEEQEWK